MHLLLSHAAAASEAGVQALHGLRLPALQRLLPHLMPGAQTPPDSALLNLPHEHVLAACRGWDAVDGGLPLQVAGREVDAQPHLLVITVCETLGDALSHAVDAHHQLALVMHLLRKGGNVERVVVAQQRRVGFQEPDRLRGTFPGARPVPFRQSIRSAPGLRRRFCRASRIAPVQPGEFCRALRGIADLSQS